MSDVLCRGLLIRYVPCINFGSKASPSEGGYYSIPRTMVPIYRQLF
jgi:hypothetical protein